MAHERWILIALRSTVIGALLVGFTSLAIAQKPKPPVGPPVTTQGTMKSSPKADKGQATAESKRAEARERKAAKGADKLQNLEQRTALKVARGEPKALLKGIKLGKVERKSQKAIEHRYSAEIKEIAAQARIAEKAGQADPSVVARLEALRARERAELRAGLTPAQQVRFDANLAAYSTRKS